jgi:hypothetical protein
MKVDFNNVRRQACIAYDKLIDRLNQSEDYEGHLLVNPSDIEDVLNDLRQTIGCIAMCYQPGDDDQKDVYSELYPEGQKMKILNVPEE